MDEFLIRALIAGCGLAVTAGPFGCLVVWRRMAYFGDTIAHGALLGVVLSLIGGTDASVGIIGTALLMAGLQAWLLSHKSLSSDTILGILSHATLALGLVLLSLLDQVRVNLLGWLLGDILAVGWNDVAAIWLGGMAALLCLWRMWGNLLAMAVDEGLAAAEGIPIPRTRLILLWLVALVVALAIKVVGLLLVTAMLVIPAAAARPLAHDPERMAALASLTGILAVCGGLAASWWLDTPSGPSIVLAATLIFGITQAITRHSP